MHFDGILLGLAATMALQIASTGAAPCRVPADEAWSVIQPADLPDPYFPDEDASSSWGDFTDFDDDDDDDDDELDELDSMLGEEIQQNSDMDADIEYYARLEAVCLAGGEIDSQALEILHDWRLRVDNYASEALVLAAQADIDSHSGADVHYRNDLALKNSVMSGNRHITLALIRAGADVAQVHPQDRDLLSMWMKPTVAFLIHEGDTKAVREKLDKLASGGLLSAATFYHYKLIAGDNQEMVQLLDSYERPEWTINGTDNDPPLVA